MRGRSMRGAKASYDGALELLRRAANAGDKVSELNAEITVEMRGEISSEESSLRQVGIIEWHLYYRLAICAGLELFHL